jgi:hypothetical protein
MHWSTALAADHTGFLMRRLFALTFASTALLWAAVAAVRAKEFTVLVYNVENLAAADGRTLSDDYRPQLYSRAHLLTKLNNIARLCAQYEDGRGPDLILFQEIERDINADQYLFDHAGMLRAYRGVRIEDMLGRLYNREIARMPVEALLLKMLEDRGLTGYRVAAADDAMEPGPRRRVAHLNVIFSRFVIGSVQTYLLPDAPAILEVQVEVEGKPLYLFNNHWRAGVDDYMAERSRIKAASIVRERLDEILGNNPSADILVAGDLNCFHDQKLRYGWPRSAINDVLRARADEMTLRGPHADLYNLWYELPPSQRGCGVVQGHWTTFMHLILSRGLYDFSGIQYIDDSFEVGAFSELNITEDGEPYRWSFKGVGQGFSHQFPLAARFRTVATKRTDQFVNARGGGGATVKAAKK